MHTSPPHNYDNDVPYIYCCIHTYYYYNIHTATFYDYDCSCDTLLWEAEGEQQQGEENELQKKSRIFWKRTCGVIFRH